VSGSQGPSWAALEHMQSLLQQQAQQYPQFQAEYLQTPSLFTPATPADWGLVDPQRRPLKRRPVRPLESDEVTELCEDLLRSGRDSVYGRLEDWLAWDWNWHLRLPYVVCLHGAQFDQVKPTGLWYREFAEKRLDFQARIRRGEELRWELCHVVDLLLYDVQEWVRWHSGLYYCLFPRFAKVTALELRLRVDLFRWRPLPQPVKEIVKEVLVVPPRPGAPAAVALEDRLAVQRRRTVRRTDDA